MKPGKIITEKSIVITLTLEEAKSLRGIAANHSIGWPELYRMLHTVVEEASK